MVRDCSHAVCLVRLSRSCTRAPREDCLGAGPCDGEVIPSACCPQTSHPTTNLTLISALSFCAPHAGENAPRGACRDNGRILLVNVPMPTIVLRMRLR